MENILTGILLSAVFVVGFAVIFKWGLNYIRMMNQAEDLFKKMNAIYLEARKGDATKSEIEDFFYCSDKALSLLPEQPKEKSAASLKLKIEKMTDQLTLIHAAQSSAVSLGDEIDKLASLRKKGMISDNEFAAFSERFKLSTGQRASDVVKAISDLYNQRRQGAMSEGNYHAALWSLMDKLDRKT